MTAKTQILTQTLNAWNMSDGTVQIHAAGCSHHPNSGRKNARQQDQVEFGSIAYPSQFQFAYSYWNNGILEEHEAEYGKGSFDVFQEMDFKPCVTIPVWTDEDKAFEVARNGTPAKVNARSTTQSANAKRALARKMLLDAIDSKINDVFPSDSWREDAELVEMMKAQRDRVAKLFS